MATSTLQRTRARRPFFRRGQEHVFVRPVRLGRNHTAAPGEPVEGMRTFQRRSLYQRHLIGVVDDPWTEQMLAAYSERVERETQRREELSEAAEA